MAWSEDPAEQERSLQHERASPRDHVCWKSGLNDREAGEGLSIDFPVRDIPVSRIPSYVVLQGIPCHSSQQARKVIRSDGYLRYSAGAVQVTLQCHEYGTIHQCVTVVVALDLVKAGVLHCSKADWELEADGVAIRPCPFQREIAAGRP